MLSTLARCRLGGPARALVQRGYAGGGFDAEPGFGSAPACVPDGGRVRLNRSIICVQGPDAPKFLNGMLTIQPPDSLESVEPVGRYAAMLNARGRVIADTFVYTGEYPQSYYLDVDSTLVDRVLRTLEFYRLSANVDIRPAEMDVWASWDETASQPPAAPEGALINVEDTRAPGLAHRSLVAREASLASQCGHEADFRLRRYVFGVPEGAAEIEPGRALPLEYCMDYMGGIDLDKGCYLGQELTIRTHHRGVVRKRVVPVVFTKKDQPVPQELYLPKRFDVAVGTEINDRSPIPHREELAKDLGFDPFRSTPKARPAGTVVAVLGNVGLAVMRLDRFGHDFHIHDTDVHALTPFWWPDPKE